MILEHIDSPADLRILTPEELTTLAEEIRGFIVDAVTATGGHLGSNLGVVELTLALHRTFDSPDSRTISNSGRVLPFTSACMASPCRTETRSPGRARCTHLARKSRRGRGCRRGPAAPTTR